MATQRVHIALRNYIFTGFLKFTKNHIGEYIKSNLIMTDYNIYRKLELKRVNYARLRKGEVAEYANRVLTVVDKHDPELLLFKPVYDLLTAKQTEIDILGLRYGIDPLRFEFDKKKSKLHLTISTLKLKVRLLSKSSNDADLVLITSHVDSYLRYLHNYNEKEISQRVKGFTNKVKAHQPLKEALLNHELMEYVEQIELAHTDMQSVINKRVQLLSERPDIPTPFLIASVSNSIDDLFKGIEVAHLTNTELDYEPLVSELNKLTDMFKLTLNLRDAYNKRKAEGKEGDEPDMDGGDEESTEGVQPTSTGNYNGYDPYKVYVIPSDEEESTEASLPAEDGDGEGTPLELASNCTDDDEQPVEGDV